MRNERELKRLVLTAMLLALCVLGANIKIMGSIALDSLPAFLGAILLGPWFGAFLGIAGHLISAGLSGFPLSIPIHLIIAIAMGVCMGVFGFIRRGEGPTKFSKVLISDLVAYVINVPLAIACLYPLMKASVLVFFMPLTFATVVNIVLCEVVYVALPNRVSHASFLQ